MRLMRSMAPGAVVIALTACIGLLTPLVSSCATRPASVTCSEYTPPHTCSAGFTMECTTTADGCEQCACVPTGDEGGRSPYLSPR